MTSRTPQYALAMKTVLSSRKVWFRSGWTMRDPKVHVASWLDWDREAAVRPPNQLTIGFFLRDCGSLPMTPILFKGMARPGPKRWVAGCI